MRPGIAMRPYWKRGLVVDAELTLEQVRPIREDIERGHRGPSPNLACRADHRRDVIAPGFDLFRGRCGAQFWARAVSVY